MQGSNVGPVRVEKCLSGPDQYKLCSNGACVLISENCPCPVGEFQCTDGQCIPRDLVCNGANNCLRGEDEHCSDIMEHGLSVSAVAAIVSASVVICVLLTVLVCLFFAKRQRNNTSQESQAALNPLEKEKLSDAIEYSEQIDKNYKTRHKHSPAYSIIKEKHSQDKCSTPSPNWDNLKDKQVSDADDAVDRDKCLDRYVQSDSEHKTSGRTIKTAGSNNCQMHNKIKSCQGTSNEGGKNTSADSTMSTFPGLRLCACEETQTKMGKYVYKPRTRAPPKIYHSYVPSHTEPSTPESVDFDRDKISFLFAHEFLCASTPKQTVKQLVLHAGPEIQFIDE